MEISILTTQSEYERGFKNAEADIASRGIEWARSMSGAAFTGTGSFSIGYSTAINLHMERLAN